jgi:hypothetical protein
MPISIATPAMASAAIVDPVPDHRHAVLECVDQLPEPETIPAHRHGVRSGFKRRRGRDRTEDMSRRHPDAAAPATPNAFAKPDCFC